MHDIPRERRVTSPYGTPAEPRTPRRTRRGGGGLLMILFLVGIMMFGVSYLVSPEPDIGLKSDVAFATVGGQDVVLVYYERAGARGVAQMALRDVFQDRLTAIDLGTGEPVWDVQLSGEHSWSAGVLAAGDRYAYVASDAGLTIVRLDDGSVVARGSGVAGLGDSYLAETAAYGYDGDRAAVIALDAGGRLHTIPLDGVTAAPADAATSAAWAGRLSADGSPPFTPDGAAKESAVVGAGGTVQLEKPAGDASGARLTWVRPDERHEPLGDTTFHDAGILLDQAPLLNPRVQADGFYDEPELSTAAGLHTVVVQHIRAANDDTVVLSVVSLDTGEITATTTIGEEAGRAVSAPGGEAVVLVSGDSDRYESSELVIVGPDGRLKRITVGTTDFFGALT